MNVDMSTTTMIVSSVSDSRIMTSNGHLAFHGHQKFEPFDLEGQQ